MTHIETTTAPDQQALARARAEELDHLRTQHAFDPSAYNTFMLAKALWRNGRYQESLAQFERASESAPLAPDGHVALVRAALSLGRLERADAYLTRAEAACPPVSDLAIHRAQLLAAGQPAAARTVLAPHLAVDPLAALFHDALAHRVEGGRPPPRPDLPPDQRELWEGLRWLADQPGAALVGCPSEVLGQAMRAARLDGLVLEFGVYFGRSLTQLAALAGQPVHGFDSFLGAPAADTGGNPVDSTAGLLPDVPDNAHLHAGWFEQSLPAFLARHHGPARLLHIDCGRHDSAATVLAHAGDRIVPGTVVAFANFIGYPGSAGHEFGAWHEFAGARGLRWRALAGTLLGREVALQVEDGAA